MKNILPKKISIFPLRGAVFFPKTNLPLNIFEDRYLKMVEDALKNDGHIGMIQSKDRGGDIFRVGCLGKIDKHERTADGRILINLKGLTRFSINDEVENNKKYREFNVNYEEFSGDMMFGENEIKKDLLKKLTEDSTKFFNQQGMLINWQEFSRLKNFQQIFTLAMISPFSVAEKQKLLECPNLNEVAKVLHEMIRFGFYENQNDKNSVN
jgi:Lon protease-like protein